MDSRVDHNPPDTTHGSRVGAMLAHRLRRWSNIDPARDPLDLWLLGQCAPMCDAKK